MWCRIPVDFIIGDINKDRLIQKYSVVIWGGVGKGCLGETKDVNTGWKQIISQLFHLVEENGYLIVECIEPYAASVSSICNECNNAKAMTTLRLHVDSSEEHNIRSLFLYHIDQGH